jgi:hypothetical protein
MADQLGQFENLPAELRAKVYANISPPLNGAIEDFQSIMLANRHLKGEVEGELIRNMKLFLEDIMNEWPKTWHSPLRIAMPTSISDISKVNIIIPKSYSRRNNFDLPNAPALLLPLLDLHVSSITVTFYDGEKFDAPIEAMGAGHSFEAHVACFIQRMSSLFTAGAFLMCDDGNQHTCKDDCKINAIAVRWDSDEPTQRERMEEAISFAILVSRFTGYRKVEWIKSNNNIAGMEWQLL